VANGFAGNSFNEWDQLGSDAALDDVLASVEDEEESEVMEVVVGNDEPDLEACVYPSATPTQPDAQFVHILGSALASAR
jgi:hypothetical protein